MGMAMDPRSMVSTILLALSLGPAWPNPFRGSTEIAFSAPAGQDRLTAGVYDIRGRLVAELAVNEEREGAIVWDGRLSDGSEAPSAVYFVRMAAGVMEARTSIVKLR